MRSSTRLYFLVGSLTTLLLTLLILAACAGQTAVPLISTMPAVASPTHLREMPATYTPTASPTSIPPTATAIPTITPTPLPTVAATPIEPMLKGTSIGPYLWSPNSRWLPYMDFNAQALHFYDPARSATCDFSVSVKDPASGRFMAWLPDGRVVVQAADKVMAGLPCGKFVPATSSESAALDHQDPSYSPDGRYQVVTQPYQGSSQDVNTVIDLKEVATGKNLVETNFYDLPRGGSSLPGYWLDPTHFLVSATADQGPLLLVPGKPVIKIAEEFFRLPLKPGSGLYDNWLARAAVTTNPNRFHLMLIGQANQAVTNPLQIYHSENGQVETLPYFAVQGSFTNDGHWLLINQNTSQAGFGAIIRPIDPSKAPFETFTDRSDLLYTWSPDGSQVIAMSNMADGQSVISLYSSPKRTFLTAWSAPDYQLFPYWSPDGKYLAVSARSYSDYNQVAIFVIRVPPR